MGCRISEEAERNRPSLRVSEILILVVILGIAVHAVNGICMYVNSASGYVVTLGTGIWARTAQRHVEREG
jgi:ribose/xylose/arabinose/galactoside ABC-type transport system permease subunit